MKINDKIIFSEDGFKTEHKGIIKNESFFSFYVQSKSYGKSWIPKTNCKKI